MEQLGSTNDPAAPKADQSEAALNLPSPRQQQPRRTEDSRVLKLKGL